MFKVGDKVVRTKDPIPEQGLFLDTVYTVEEISDSTGGIRVKEIRYFFFLAEKFKLAEDVTQPMQTQVGGSHYKDLKIQPVEYIMANNIPYMEGNVVKYCTRWRDKGGVQDLEKAMHYLQMLIEKEKSKGV